MLVSTPCNGITHITAAWHFLPLCKQRGGQSRAHPLSSQQGEDQERQGAGGKRARGPTHLTEVLRGPLVVCPRRYLSSASSASAVELNSDVRPSSQSAICQWIESAMATAASSFLLPSSSVFSSYDSSLALSLLNHRKIWWNTFSLHGIIL